MSEYKACINSVSRLTIDLGDESIVIDWPAENGEDIGNPVVKEWLKVIRQRNTQVGSNCIARRICEESAGAKREGEIFCLGCDFFPDGITGKAQKSLNGIITESGGREDAISKSPKFVFEDFSDDPKLLLSFGEGVGDDKEKKELSALPFLIQENAKKPTTEPPVVEERVVEEREITTEPVTEPPVVEKDKVTARVKKKTGTRKRANWSWPRLPQLELRSESIPPKSIGMIPIGKARKKAARLAKRLNESVEIWKKVSSTGKTSRLEVISPDWKGPGKKKKKEKKRIKRLEIGQIRDSNLGNKRDSSNRKRGNILSRSQKLI